MRTQQEAEPDLAKVAAELALRRTQSPAAKGSCQPIGHDLEAMAKRLSNTSRHKVDPAEQQRRDAEEARREAEAKWRPVQASIGKRYAMTTFENYEIYDPAQRDAVEIVRQYAANIPEHVERGEGLILFGTVGTGKDHLLSCVLREAAMTHGVTVSHVYGLDLHAKVRDAMDDDKVEQVLRPYREAKLFAISDPLPNDGQLTPWNKQTLMRLVNARYVAMRPTLLTINAPSLSQTQDVGINVWDEMSDAVFDRLAHGAIVVECRWPSYRQRVSR